MRKQIHLKLIGKMFQSALRFRNISLLGMVLKRLKLHTNLRWCGTKCFLHTSMWNYTIFVKNDVALHHLATLFDNTNVISKREQGEQFVHGAFCQTITKSCLISSNTLQILLPKYFQFSANFMIKRVILTMDPFLIVLLKLI